jgi:hypothetical protein
MGLVSLIVMELGARDRASMQLRRELLSLAGALSDTRPGTATTVSVKFSEATDGREDSP